MLRRFSLLEEESLLVQWRREWRNRDKFEPSDRTLDRLNRHCAACWSDGVPCRYCGGRFKA